MLQLSVIVTTTYNQGNSCVYTVTANWKEKKEKKGVWNVGGKDMILFKLVAGFLCPVYHRGKTGN